MEETDEIQTPPVSLKDDRSITKLLKLNNTTEEGQIDRKEAMKQMKKLTITLNNYVGWHEERMGHLSMALKEARKVLKSVKTQKQYEELGQLMVATIDWGTIETAYDIVDDLEKIADIFPFLRPKERVRDGNRTKLKSILKEKYTPEARELNYYDYDERPPWWEIDEGSPPRVKFDCENIKVHYYEGESSQETLDENPGKTSNELEKRSETLAKPINPMRTNENTQ